MDHKELLKKYLEAIEDCNFDSEENRSAIEEFEEIADLDIGDSPLVVECEVYYGDENILDETVYLGAQSVGYYQYNRQWLDPEVGQAFAYEGEVEFCLTEDLKTIEEEVKEQYRIVANEGVAKFFLINPRKDVVEWALKHKDELRLTTVNREFIEKHQAIPELKELILNTLEKKGE